MSGVPPAGMAPQGPAPPGPQPPTVWEHSRPVGFVESVKVVGGIAAPLLAGFSLTAVIQLLTLGADVRPPLTGLAVAAFSLAGAFLLYCLQFSAVAVGFAAAPSDYLDYSPEASHDPAAFARLRAVQHEDGALRRAYNARAGLCYNLGLITFLFGFGFVLVPRHWFWFSGRPVGLAAVLVALVVEIVWTTSNASRPKVMLPGWANQPPPVPDSLYGDGFDLVAPPPPPEPEPDHGAEILAELRRMRELIEES